ncbi:MAG: type II toxin-antitoxin system BrnA family antitoxin [Terriglobia bacterium]
MRKKLGKRSPRKRVEIEEIAERAESGEDISEYFTGQYSAKQRVNIDFPLNLLRQIDTECRRLGVTRQAWIKMACDERIRQIESSPRQKRAS